MRAFYLSLGLFAFLAACSDTTDHPITADSGVRTDNGGGGNADAVGGEDVVADGDTGVDGGMQNLPDADVDGGTHDATVCDEVNIPRDPACPGTATWLTRVCGTVLDDNGDARSGAKAQLCVRRAPGNVLVCLIPKSADDIGSFLIDVPDLNRCIEEGTMRFLRPAESNAPSYCRLEIGGASQTLHVVQPFTTYATDAPNTIPPRGDPMTERTIVFRGGLELDLVPSNYFPGSGSYDDLAASMVTLAPTDTCELAGEAPFDGVWAMAEEGDIHGRARLRIPNDALLPPNTAVRVFVLGGLGCSLDDVEDLPEGEWAEIEGSMVSADGTTIDVNPGIPCISWVAYRRN